MASQASQKRSMIDAANKGVIVATSVAAFVVVFSLVASHALFSQLMYQNRIVTAKKQTLSQLKTDAAAVANLQTAYNAFVNTPQNVIGGNPTGTGDKDGDNAKIILDALPSKYDFPALATSLEKIMSAQNVKIQSINGTDDEVAQGSASASANPQPIEMPFQVSAQGNYQNIQNLTKTFEASIRPIQVKTLSLSGDDSNLTITVGASSYYQPEKVFKLGTKVIK